MQYRIEQRLHTLSDLAVDGKEPNRYGFTVEDVTFSNWQINEGEGYWTHQYWLATANIEAPNYKEAWHQFIQKQVRIVSKMALISQCYMEHQTQPVLIKRQDIEVAYFYWVENRVSGLMFMEQERTALDHLLANTDIPKAFFYYWRDAVNTFGYSSKLLLMLSAVEALTGVRHAERKISGDLHYQKLEEILGQNLKEKFWGTKRNSKDGLRHRLVHGEYFDPKDHTGINYVVEIHRSVIKYFNEHIFRANLLEEAIVSPQRHPMGTRYQGFSFIKAIGNAKLCLIDVLADADKHGSGTFENYEKIMPDDDNETY